MYRLPAEGRVRSYYPCLPHRALSSFPQGYDVLLNEGDSVLFFTLADNFNHPFYDIMTLGNLTLLLF